jgi:hypothetical protein
MLENMSSRLMRACGQSTFTEPAPSTLVHAIKPADPLSLQDEEACKWLVILVDRI